MFRFEEGQGFVPSNKFEGPRKGYSFGTGDQGTGYYRDSSSEAVPDSLRRERRTRSRSRSRSPPRRRSRTPPRHSRDSHHRHRHHDRARSRSRERYEDRVEERGRQDGPSSNTDAPPAELTKEQREKAALERLMAKRAGGQGTRPGGIPRHGFR